MGNVIEVVVVNSTEQLVGLIENLVISNDLVDQEKLGQLEDEELTEFKEKYAYIVVDCDGVMRFRGRLYEPKDDALRRSTMEEAHKSRFPTYSRLMKMYQNLNRVYWWIEMKRDVLDFVSKCQNCQLMKAQHQLPGGL